MVREIGQGRNHIAFEDFVAYWDGVHPTQRAPPQQASPDSEPWSLDDARNKKRTWHQARFKFMKAKVYNPVVGRIYTVSEGTCPSLEYRVRFFYDDAESGERVQISAWHDVPYKNVDGSYNMIVEIPKWSRCVCGTKRCVCVRVRGGVWRVGAVAAAGEGRGIRRLRGSRLVGQPRSASAAYARAPRDRRAPRRLPTPTRPPPTGGSLRSRRARPSTR